MGDVAYDLEDDNGTRGDTYFQVIEPFVSNISYMVSIFKNYEYLHCIQYTPGNHEAAHNWSNQDARFFMPLHESH